MRYRIKEYSVSVSNNVVTLSFEVPDGMVISIDPDDGSLDQADERFIEESVRLIIDETNKVVLCSSMQKDSIINIEAQGIQGESTADTIIIYIAIPTGKTVSASDKFTVEFDWGESLGDVAKQGDNPNTSLSDVKTSVNTMTSYVLGILSNGAKEATLGAAPIGSDKTTVFQYLASIYNSIVGSVSPDIPEGVAERLAMILQFFGIYTEDDKVLVRVPDGQDYQIVPAEFMTDTEVTDELEDIMGNLDIDLNETVEYPEGSGTYMTKAQLITIQAMQIINDDEEQS